MIRGIQVARKELGFQVTDRLQLSLNSGNEMLGKILVTHQTMIEKETLTTIQLGKKEEGKELEIDEGFSVNMTLTK